MFSKIWKLLKSYTRWNGYFYIINSSLRSVLRSLIRFIIRFYDWTRNQYSQSFPHARIMSRTTQVKLSETVVGQPFNHLQHQFIGSAGKVQMVSSTGAGLKKPHRWRPGSLAVSVQFWKSCYPGESSTVPASTNSMILTSRIFLTVISPKQIREIRKFQRTTELLIMPRDMQLARRIRGCR